MKVARFPDGSPEIFHTLQGEGPSIGCPAIFLRLSLCNLHCHWCDTPYTWNFEGTPWDHQDPRKFSKAEQILDISPEDLAPQLQQFACNRLVLTGGEPLLQQRELNTLIPLLKGIEFIEIETNGTQLPSPELDQLVSSYNVSPKLSNAKVPESLRLNEKSLHFFAQSQKAQFKFVISSQTDLQEVKNFQNDFKIKKNHILLMPEGRDSDTINQRSKELSTICISEGYRLSTRLHVLIWGDQRGR